MVALIIWGPGGARGCLGTQETYLADFTGGPVLAPTPAFRVHPSAWPQWGVFLPEIPTGVSSLFPTSVPVVSLYC